MKKRNCFCELLNTIFYDLKKKNKSGICKV